MHGVAETEVESEAILQTQLMDNALYSFLKIIVDIENSNDHGVLKSYSEHKGIKKRFLHGFRVQMGFGLHYGWAIEGVCCGFVGIDRWLTYLCVDLH